MFGRETAHLSQDVELFQQDWDGATPFAIATVVHTVGTTAAKAGTRAVITNTGHIIGFVGGGCVRRALLDSSAAAMADGKSRFVTTMPREEISSDSRSDGEVVYPSSCPSRGEMKFFIEPVLPKPPLLVFGETELSRSVLAIGSTAGFVARMIADSSDPPSPGTISVDAVSAYAGLNAGFIVVATQGVGDKAALSTALGSPCPHIFFVASEKKAKHIRSVLLRSGVGDEELSRLISPAGLPIGAEHPNEIAIAIAAEMIRIRRNAPGDSGVRNPRGN